MIYVVTERNLLAGRILDGLWDGEEVTVKTEKRTWIEGHVTPYLRRLMLRRRQDSHEVER